MAENLLHSAETCDMVVGMASNHSVLRQNAESTSGLGNAIRARRRHLGLTQEELADLSGVGVRLIHEVEHGKTTVGLAGLLAILNVLGLHLELRSGAATTVLTSSAGRERVDQ